MMDIPVSVQNSAVPYGPGSQPEEQDGSALDILQLPNGMMTFSLPDLPEADDVTRLSEAKQVLEKLLSKMQQYDLSCPSIRIDISHLDELNKQMVDQVLGEGEVSVVFTPETLSEQGIQRIEIQEAVLAGIWRIKSLGEDNQLISDEIEVASIPDIVLSQSFNVAEPQIIGDKQPIPKGVLNAPPLIAEINDKIKQFKHESNNIKINGHVINLSLLPQTAEDISFLSDRLGTGVCTILSRGYGNCRISSTATHNVWWVQYFNSQDTNILNSLEIIDVPNVACAAQEDIEDSTQRLEEILEAYR